MAKRKRLEVPTEPFSPGLETKSEFPPKARMPISEVAGEVAGRAALEEVAREMTAAEEEGRVIKRLAIDRIASHHLSRDRMVMEDEDLMVLAASIAERGQQTPIEVVQLADGDYGLISGLRRIEALRDLGEDSVLALIRHPECAADAYQAMVEENEIRVDLSFYERAHIAMSAVEQGVFPDTRLAIANLFGNAPKAKRSKINRFVTICEKLGKSLSFPTAIPEKLGLALASAIEADPSIARRLSDALRKTPPRHAAGERKAIERALNAPRVTHGKPPEIAPGLRLETRKGRVVLTGVAVDADFIDALSAWAVSHAKPRG